MKTKLILSTAFMILILGITFVYATMTATSLTTGTKINYEVSVSVEKGWNLILATPVDPSSTNKNSITSDSQIQEENIGMAYYYSRTENKYLQLYPNSQELEDYIGNAQSKPEEIAYFAQAPIWIYSDKTGILKYLRHDLPNVINPPLSAGWNFVTIVPGAIGKSLNQLKGDCSFDKVYFWNAGAQGWFEFSLSEIISSEYAGSGLITKVSSNCQLNLGSSGSGANPPQVPQ